MASPGTNAHRITVSEPTVAVRVELDGVVVAETERARVLREGGLPPRYYLPRDDVRMELLVATEHATSCPFKGDASYWTLRVGDEVVENALWAYEDPLPEAEGIRGYVAFYRNRMDAWYEEDEEVRIDPVTDVHEHGNPLVDWLLRDAWEATSVPELLSRLARQLRAVGIPVTRATLIERTLHPQVLGTVHWWSTDADRVESQVRAGHRRLATGWLEKCGEHAQGRGLASPVGPEEANDLPLLDDEVHAAHCLDFFLSGLVDATQASRFDHRLCHRRLLQLYFEC